MFDMSGMAKKFLTSPEGQQMIREFITSPEGMDMVKGMIASPEGKKAAAGLLLSVVDQLPVQDEVKGVIKQALQAI